MADIVADAKAWLAEQPGDVATHSENCHQWHTECLVARLVAAVERHRMTEEERACCLDCATVAEAYAENDGDPECERIARIMQGLWQRTK